MAGFDTLPNKVDIPVVPFKIKINDSELERIEALIKNAKPDIETYYNTTTEADLGTSYSWLQEAKKSWRDNYNWREREKRINSFPHFKASLRDRYDDPIDLHFMALFSKNPKAVPILCTHGWPGCFLEYLGVCEILRTKYSPETLPYHVIVPSLPGFTFSDLPSRTRRHTIEDSADIIHRLMMGLGFGDSGYIPTGGDLGSYTSRVMAVKYQEAKALLINLSLTSRPAGFDDNELDEDERMTLARAAEFPRTGSGYAIIQGTKPATTAAALESHPYSLLAWMGEKYVSWAGVPLPIEEIIDTVILYWATNSISRNFWAYIELFGLTTTGQGPLSLYLHGEPEWFCHKPFGYSFFPYENGAMPKKWVATTGNLIFYGKHHEGGHFAAWENPKAITGDIEEFVKLAWTD